MQSVPQNEPSESAPYRKVRFTYDDYLNLPEGRRYEIIDGDLNMTPAPNIKHQKVSLLLSQALLNFCQLEDLGTVLCAPVDVYLTHEDIIQPDLLFVAKEREGIIEPNYIRGAPDLMVEIVSPASAKRDRSVKRSLYARHGVREYWIVDPDAKTVEVAVWTDGEMKTAQVYPSGSTLQSPLLPGLKIKLSQIGL